jgi:predicted nucleic acid-binding protein
MYHEADLYEVDLQDRVLYLSFQTVAEMRAGAEKAAWGTRRRKELETFLGGYDLNDMLSVWAHVRAALGHGGP